MKKCIDIFHICGYMFNAKNNKSVDLNFIKKNIGMGNHITIIVANVKEARWVLGKIKMGIQRIENIDPIKNY